MPLAPELPAALEVEVALVPLAAELEVVVGVVAALM
jgi:hypothetical protein